MLRRGISSHAREKALLSNSLSGVARRGEVRGETGGDGMGCDATPSTLMNMKCDREAGDDDDDEQTWLSRTFILTVQYMKKAPRTITRNKTGLAARTTCNKSFRSLNHALSRAAGFVRADIVGRIDRKR